MKAPRKAELYDVIERTIGILEAWALCPTGNYRTWVKNFRRQAEWMRETAKLKQSNQ